MKLEIVHARSIVEAIIDFTHQKKFDLLLLDPSTFLEVKGRKSVHALLNEIVQKSNCRAWVCSPTSETPTLGNVAGVKKL